MRRSILVTVLRATQGARTALNAPARSWPVAGDVYAAWAPRGGAEGEAAAQEQSVTRGTLRIRRNDLTDAITTRDRLRFRGADWEIESVIPEPGPRRDEIDIHVMRRTDVPNGL